MTNFTANNNAVTSNAIYRVLWKEGWSETYDYVDNAIINSIWDSIWWATTDFLNEI